eukprot:c34294_g1_i1 orf=2-259(-)
MLPTFSSCFSTSLSVHSFSPLCLCVHGFSAPWLFFRLRVVWRAIPWQQRWRRRKSVPGRGGVGHCSNFLVVDSHGEHKDEQEQEQE